MAATRIGDATIMRVNHLTYIVRDGIEGFWLDERSGLVGIDDDEGNTSWSRPGVDGFEVVRVSETSEDQYQVLEALTLFER